ncbi:E3 ubiquitin protein ligase rie1 [Phtheirospermum japonicum]|uniref:E3 ubiquitin protein ligase rie1 n=1 Tax=Phtheirospermum japonicum TaxID=374723 RepID=A0A830BYU3_9LAMI|nr:E3 ubiquitin protein ligase rie1 [Phtheirospermum japonicum]
MGSEFGYEYRYGFSMVDENQINSKFKSKKPTEDGGRVFVFEIRTNFIAVLWTDYEEERVLIDSESFDTYLENAPDDMFLRVNTCYRLKDYWMTLSEITNFTRSAFAFAERMAARPENASLSHIPVVVSFEVCTVQKEGELHEAVMDRAICNRRLVPLYLYPCQTITEMPKPMDVYVKQTLRRLPRTRVEDTDQELASPMSACHFCSKRPCAGAQITLLRCNHAFHSHCIVRWLEDNNLCPLCDYDVYFRFNNTPQP